MKGWAWGQERLHHLLPPATDTWGQNKQSLSTDFLCSTNYRPLTNVFQFLHCTIFITGNQYYWETFCGILIQLRHLCSSFEQSKSWQASSSLVTSGPLYRMRSIEQASTDRPSARSARKGRPPETSSDDSWAHKQTASSGLAAFVQCSTSREWFNSKYKHVGPASAPTLYLSSDSAGEAPHGFIGGVVFTSTPHLKGKRHSVSFNLKQDT